MAQLISSGVLGPVPLHRDRWATSCCRGSQTAGIYRMELVFGEEETEPQ